LLEFDFHHWLIYHGVGCSKVPDIHNIGLMEDRANRNNTAHDYGVQFADQTLTLLPAYVQDVRLLATKLQEVFDAAA
jgi:hypothetical protein